MLSGHPVLLATLIAVAVVVLAPLLARPERTTMSLLAASAGLATAVATYAPWFSEIDEGPNFGRFAERGPWCCWNGAQPPFHGHWVIWLALAASVLSASTFLRPSTRRSRLASFGAALCFLAACALAAFHAFHYAGREFERLCYYEVEFGLPLTILFSVVGLLWAVRVSLALEGEIRLAKRRANSAVDREERIQRSSS